eukprot:gene4464-3259_t
MSLVRSLALRGLRFPASGVVQMRKAELGALVGARRRISGCPLTSACCCVSTCPFLTNLSAHSAQLAGCTTLSGLMYSPLGTAMLLLLAYNVVVIGTKHLYYTMDLTAKDYVQDQQLYAIMRYGIMCCLLLGMEVLFVEV